MTEDTLAHSARTLLRTARSATLATLDRTGGPFASFVTLANDFDGSPLLLLSDLAIHTQNLRGDSRGSLMISDGAGRTPLEGARITLVGDLELTQNQVHRDRFLARHRDAASYATFQDFNFYRFAVRGLHLVAGFGKITQFEPGEILTDCSKAGEVTGAGTSIADHINTDHPDFSSLIAESLMGEAPGKWRAEGCDPDGIDFRNGGQTIRYWFPLPVQTLLDVRKEMKNLAETARNSSGQRA